MGQIVHQIWVGPKMPERERAWVEGIRKASTAAGWEHRLYNLRDLAKALPNDSALARIAEYGVIYNRNTKLAGLISDYARLALLAKFEGLYLDTDWKYNGPKWPEFPQEPGFYGQGGVTKNTQGNCILYIAPGTDKEKINKLHQAAAKKVLRVFSEAEPFDTEENALRSLRQIPWLPHFLGPTWIYQQIGNIIFLPRSLATFSFWGNKAVLTHVSIGRWGMPPQD